MLEYVVLGDFQTAVAFLLASAPEASVRYYRDVVCTVVLAASATRTNKASPPSLLHIQVRRVGGPDVQRVPAAECSLRSCMCEGRDHHLRSCCMLSASADAVNACAGMSSSVADQPPIHHLIASACPANITPETLPTPAHQLTSSPAHQLTSSQLTSSQHPTPAPAAALPLPHRHPTTLLLAPCLQAAKVVSAHMASVGDSLLGVPLHCSAGLFADAAILLQEAGLWRYASTLAAHSLAGGDRALALQRWGHQVAAQEGSLWRAVGILTSAGCLRAALQVGGLAGACGGCWAVHGPLPVHGLALVVVVSSLVCAIVSGMLVISTQQGVLVASSGVEERLMLVLFHMTATMKAASLEVLCATCSCCRSKRLNSASPCRCCARRSCLTAPRPTWRHAARQAWCSTAGPPPAAPVQEEEAARARPLCPAPLSAPACSSRTLSWTTCLSSSSLSCTTYWGWPTGWARPRAAGPGARLWVTG